MTDAAGDRPTQGLAPYSLKDKAAFIERQFPVGRLSAEAHKERKAGAGQTLTALGSYWKGRKPLVLVRAVVLGCLLPSSDHAAADLDVFLKLMAMDDDAFGRRFSGSAADFARLFPEMAEAAATQIPRDWQSDPSISEPPPLGRWRWRDDIEDEERQAVIATAFTRLPYAERLRHVLRPEECDQASMLTPIWEGVNRHLGTSANSLATLVEELGIARFGHRPKVVDTFCGGGSIPFEAARMGCDVFASDLNPIAAMLTWGAFHIIGASQETRAEMLEAQERVELLVDDEITRLDVEHDSVGNRAKAYLYCLETRCPRTGWMVPMAPSWVISKKRNVVAKLVPDPVAKRYEIEIHTGVSPPAMAAAEQGTLQGGRLVHPMNPERSGVEIKTIRGDYRDATGVPVNKLRPWERHDFIPRPGDIWQERLYCIQWITKATLGHGRQETFFRAALAEDEARERKVEALVQTNLDEWQEAGFVPDSEIEPGDETTRLLRERGWTHWHHLFAARQLLQTSALIKNSHIFPNLRLDLCQYLNLSSKICRINTTLSQGGAVKFGEVFDNQAINPIFNYAVRSSLQNISSGMLNYKFLNDVVNCDVNTQDARDNVRNADLFITDPPYANAVNYHEITEFFIAWLHKNPPPPFDQWTWESQRTKAIKGSGEEFRRDMVAAYGAMARRMPDNGQQVVMFTHQDAGVWADLASILWAAGLRVSAAWNIVTETESALKEGNYVQGTVCLVLRKRLGTANARRMEIEAEIEEAVAAQLARLNALDDAWHERAQAETLYTDGDLTLAAYAAALQAVTSYSSIDREPLDRDLYRKLAKGEFTMLRDLVDYAAQVANALLVPEGFPRDMWRDLGAAERFYVRMLDMEAKGSAKVADFQNFAKSFAFGGYTELMASTTANAAVLSGAADLKGRSLDGEGFAATQLRQVLFAIWKTMEAGNLDPKRGVTILKTEYAADYWARRQKLIALAGYVALKTARTRPEESTAAHELAEALKLDRV